MLINDVIRCSLVDEIDHIRYLVISQEALETLERAAEGVPSSPLHSLLEQIKSSRHPTIQSMFCIPVSTVEALEGKRLSA